jgi:hypothetical protein
MIRRIRLSAAPCRCRNAEELLATFKAFEESGEGLDPDEGLDMLVKNALVAKPMETDSRGGHVWQQLTRKMKGPFGAPALEAPGVSALDSELMASGGLVQLAPFALSDKAVGSYSHETPARESLWEMLRFVSSGTAQRGHIWLLS